MEKNNPKNNLNEELNVLFEKLAAGRERGLKNIEELRQRIVTRLDDEIARLYAKKDFIAETWARRNELRLQKISFLKKLIANGLWTNLRFLVSMPFIYMMIVPAVFLHLALEIYHQVCFRIYRIPRVNPWEYFIFDRQLLPYLNWFEKFNCFYCSYFNCLISYTKEVGARTERYWCPIKHSRKMKGRHSEYDRFIDYSDGEAFRKKWEDLRRFDQG